MSDPITREETYLAALSGESVNLPDPITRTEMYLAYLNGMAVNIPAPITRKDFFLYTLCQQGVGGGGVTIRNQDKTFTENGEYTADEGYTGLGTVTVAVPQEEPVVEPLEVTENGTYNPPAGVDGYAPVTVNVEAAGGGDDVARSIVERTIEEYIDSEVTILGTSAFKGCMKLHTVKVDNLLNVGEYAFQNCTSLQEIDFPKAETFGAQAFTGCSSLVSVSAPVAKYTPHTGFSGLATLANAYLPNVNGVAARCFRYCSSLVSMDFNRAAMIESEAFLGATNLRTLILRTPSVATLKNQSSLQDTPFAESGTGGVLLIPSALVTAYTEATNWSVIYGYGTNRFLAIEEYTVDGTTTGEIDWDKVNALFEEANA